MTKRIKLTIKLPEESALILQKLSLISGKSRTAIITELIAKYGLSVVTPAVGENDSRPT